MDAKTIIDMKQERAKLTASMREIMDEFENKEMPTDKSEQLSKMENDFDGLNAKIIREEKQLERERASGEKIETVSNELKSEVKELFAKALSGDAKHVREYQNALSLGTDATAGY